MMMTYNCPKGCQSTDPEYCSECGAPMKGGTVLSNPIYDAFTGEICPDCGTPQAPGGRFCEVCRYDFNSKASNSVTAPPPPPPPPAPPPVIQRPITPPPPAPRPVAPTQKPLPPVAAPKTASPKAFVPGVRLNVIIQVDPSLMTDDVEAPCPVGTPDKVFPLDLEENLIGRRSEGKQIYPEIEINDPGVSRRHLKLLRQPHGGFAALELGSANGTRLNNEVLEPGVLTPINAGDELTLGNWTRLKIVGR